MLCKICYKELANTRSLGLHIRQTHNMTSKQYYDLYLKQSNEGICPNCGKSTNFKSFTKGYCKHCSTKCSGIANKDSAIQAFKTTIANRSIDEKMQIQLKIKNTMPQNYGYTCNFLRPEVYEKSHSETARKLQRQTNLQKYGSECPFGSKIIRSRCNYKEITKHGNETKRKNGTFNTSKLEDKCYELLLLKFKDVKRNYKSDVYPFMCDFYILEKDLYIECNFHWTHGGRLFNKNNLDDMNKLSVWDEKAKTSTYYKTAINVWTIRDVEKYNRAKENKLNYLCFYNMTEFDIWLENGGK